MLNGGKWVSFWRDSFLLLTAIMRSAFSSKAPVSSWEKLFWPCQLHLKEGRGYDLICHDWFHHLLLTQTMYIHCQYCCAYALCICPNNYHVSRKFYMHDMSFSCELDYLWLILLEKIKVSSAVTLVLIKVWDKFDSKLAITLIICIALSQIPQILLLKCLKITIHLVIYLDELCTYIILNAFNNNQTQRNQ